MASTEVLDFIDKVTERLGDSMWTTSAEKYRVAGAVLITGHEDKVALLEVGQITSGGGGLGSFPLSGQRNTD